MNEDYIVDWIGVDIESNDKDINLNIISNDNNEFEPYYF